MNEQPPIGFALLSILSASLRTLNCEHCTIFVNSYICINKLKSLDPDQLLFSFAAVTCDNRKGDNLVLYVCAIDKSGMS